jgi:hypothetical protein
VNDPDAVDRWIAQLRAGIRLRVPFSTRLFPDTRAERSVLRAIGDRFELETVFHEFAAGHGWSIEQTETEPWTESEVRDALASVNPDEVTPMSA